MKLKRLPKIELHCHLDGSVDVQTLIKSDGNKVESEQHLKTLITAPNPCNNLKEYLMCFNRILPFLQTKDALAQAAYNIISQAYQENVLYIEIRLAPILHCNGGMSEIDVCKAVLSGLEMGERKFGIKSRALLCMIRGDVKEDNMKVLMCAKELREYGVCGVDLAGNEAAYPPELHKDLFVQASKWDIPFTIHAGECGDPSNVKNAIEMGARRIGHGVAIVNNDEIMTICKKQQICLEMCPVSNLQTKAVTMISDYPFIKMWNEGINSTINTDNRTISNTSLTNEWSLLKDNFYEINEALIIKANMNAIDFTFLPSFEKQKLKDEFYSQVKNSI